MPQTDSVENTTEAKIVGHLDDKAFVAQVEYIINDAMPMVSNDDNWAKILRLIYIKGLTAQSVQDRLGLEHSAFYEARKDALCAFAEMWPPFPSELVVMR